MIIGSNRNEPAAWSVKGEVLILKIESLEVIYSRCDSFWNWKTDSFHQGVWFCCWSTPSFLPTSFFFFFFMINAPANPSQSQAGKDVFSTIARCHGPGLWFRVDLLPLWREEEVRTRARPSRTRVRGGCEGPGGGAGAFLVFQGLFSYVLADWGALVNGTQLDMMDQTSWKINTHSLRRTLCHSLYCTWCNSFHQSCICEQEYTHTHAHTHTHTLTHTRTHHHCSPCSNTPAPLTHTKLQTNSQMKAGVHVRVSCTLMSWPKVMDLLITATSLSLFQISLKRRNLTFSLSACRHEWDYPLLLGNPVWAMGCKGGNYWAV